MYEFAGLPKYVIRGDQIDRFAGLPLARYYNDTLYEFAGMPKYVVRGDRIDRFAGLPEYTINGFLTPTELMALLAIILDDEID